MGVIIIVLGVNTRKRQSTQSLKGVRQGCILSPLLFDIYAEKIKREALDKWEG